MIGPSAFGIIVPKNDAQLRESERFRRFDELLPSKRHHLPANNPRHGQPLHGADRGKEQHEFSTEEDHEEDNENRKGQREDDVNNAHHQRVHFSAEKPGDGAVEHADRECHGRGAQAHRDGDLAAVKDSDKQIAAERVGPEPVAGIRTNGARRRSGFVGIFKRYGPRNDRE